MKRFDNSPLDEPGKVSGPGVPVASDLTTPNMSIINPSFNTSMLNDLSRNSTSVLCEYCQANKLPLEFTTVNELGPPHQKVFVIAAHFGSQQVMARVHQQERS